MKRKTILLRNEKISALKYATIRCVAKVIGLLVVSFQQYSMGKLHYRVLEMEKSLKLDYGNIAGKIKITQGMKIEFKWRISHVHVGQINRGNPNTTLQTDSSKEGWGIVIDNDRTDGRWTEKENLWHINVLELMAIKFALKALSARLKKAYSYFK